MKQHRKSLSEKQISPGTNPPNSPRNSSLAKSFLHAFQGLFFILRHERNIRIHVAAALLVLIASWLLRLPRRDLVVILILIGGVLSLEALNTALEKTVDLVTQEYHPLAKQAKDIAAAAVLIFAITAAVIGITIFWQPMLGLFQG